MCADHGHKSWASVENPYTLIAPKINHERRKAVIMTVDVENGMFVVSPVPCQWPRQRAVALRRLRIAFALRSAGGELRAFFSRASRSSSS
ncbi:MAG: hypothetical protein H9533_10995 [Rhodobacteraceae bacterium]|nr:hypothetical protein [Paracoccaceae bacterium]